MARNVCDEFSTYSGILEEGMSVTLQPFPVRNPQELGTQESQATPLVSAGQTQRPVSGSQMWPGRLHGSQAATSAVISCVT